MTISSAYVFAKNIKAGVAPLAQNVIFDDGQFNLNRMVSGFDFNTNIQSTPKEWGMATGQQAIEGGYMTQYIGTEAILACYGTLQEEGYVIEEKAITGVGRSRTGSECGICYYLPVNMQDLQTEGYSCMKVTVSGNAVGLPNAGPNDRGGVANINVMYTPSAGYLSSISLGLNTNGGMGIEQETEETATITFSAGDLDKVPTYIRLSCWGGTTRFKKIWFE